MTIKRHSKTLSLCIAYKQNHPVSTSMPPHKSCVLKMTM